MSPAAQAESVLVLARSTGRILGLPSASVIEVMPALPVRDVAGAPPFVLGVSIVRGIPTPVVSAARLLEPDQAPSRASHFVSLRCSGRAVALAVEGLIGVRALAPELVSDLPPLFAAPDASTGLAALALLDGELLCVLEAARLLPAELRARIVGEDA